MDFTQIGPWEFQTTSINYTIQLQKSKRPQNANYYSKVN